MDCDHVSVGMEPVARAELDLLDLPVLFSNWGSIGGSSAMRLGNIVGQVAKLGSEWMTHHGPAAPAWWGNGWMSITTGSEIGGTG